MNALRFHLAALLLFGGNVHAGAHAFLDHAEPAVGGTMQPAPTCVTAFMTENLKPELCKIQVFDSTGAEVDKKDARIKDSEMRVSVPALPPGTYKVVWHAVAWDTHTTNGTFRFTVK